MCANKIIVQIQGVNFINKGAELMMHAVLQYLNEHGILVASPLGMGGYHQRANAGLHHLLWIETGRIPLAKLIVPAVAECIPKKMKRVMHVVSNSEVSAILDASGFAYSDQWGAIPSELMAQRCKQWKNAGKKIIFLPQAFGPFETPSIRQAFQSVIANADLIYARDLISRQHLLDVARDFCSVSHIRQAPDFTNLVQGKVPTYFKIKPRRVCIIPNSRMLDKTSASVRNNYVDFLVLCLKQMFSKATEPFMLVHDLSSDQDLAREVQTNFGQPIEIISEVNPLYIKGILGTCYGVISSRYHGLVSALSQGVPSLATSWSHKYQMLLEDYGCPECLISSFESQENIKHQFDLITDPMQRQSLLESLAYYGSEQQKQTQRMWGEVLEILKR
jgi:colanic acid/amylovoran biosynthesis protein